MRGRSPPGNAMLVGAVASEGLFNRRLAQVAGIGCVLVAEASLLLVRPASQRTVPGP